jgi:hypothetical protein
VSRCGVRDCGTQGVAVDVDGHARSGVYISLHNISTHSPRSLPTQEEQRDKSFATQHAAQMMRTPSHALNASLRQEAASFQAKLEHATKSDTLVKVCDCTCVRFVAYMISVVCDLVLNRTGSH